MLNGSDGFDVIFAGSGQDIVSGGPTNDLLEGQNGNDRVFARACETINPCTFGP